MAMQARINGELAVRLGDGVAAAVVSFGTGLAVLAVLVAATGPGRRGLRAVRAALRAGSLRWWHCLGGVCGGFVVASQGLTVATLGVAVFTVALVAGQSASGLAVDRAGLGPGRAEPVTATRVAGATLCVAAVLLALADRLDAPRALGLAVLPLLAGLGVAWQQAVNGRVRAAAAGAIWPATFVNFVAGTAALLVAFAVGVAVRGAPTGALPPEPWLYAGGLLGMLVIGTAVAVVRVTGVLLLGLSAIAGNVLGALLLDLAIPTAGPPGPNTYAGVVLTLVAVAVAAARPGPRSRARTSPACGQTRPVPAVGSGGDE
ncbi:MAG: EamA-like transporter family protein [Micromonosporaceae bacterium]|nr:EamA-like transporter family protein [Micromonosporaceae bacterium]